MNLWLEDFPVPGSADYYWNARDLPAFWGIQPGDLHAGLRTDILQRYRKAVLILHPDKHGAASQQCQTYLTNMVKRLTNARDLIL
eukprot:2757652-Prorocentrum_lima.AAC.1